jgi:hypothetical protein
MLKQRNFAIITRNFCLLCCLGALWAARAAPPSVDDLAQNFSNPPSSARPWVYWFPLNGNLSSNGITADLEAMERVGIGGVLYMETDQGAPQGPARFAGPLWRDMVKHIFSEAQRLGLEVNMNNDAGWCGSGGPWITPELSMQQVVWASTNVSGPQRFTAVFPQPQARLNFYRDIAVLAFPTPAPGGLITNFQDKSDQESAEIPLHTAFATLPTEATIPRNRIVNLTSRLKANGRLEWDVPPGQWTLLRLGHTTTGVENHPAPVGGLGLESDKLSKKASDAAFAGLMAKVIADSRPLAGRGKTLVSTHIDSWETGSQNWTPRFRGEFKRLRGYDPLRFLPVMTGQVVDNLEVSERFLWDIRKTVDDLLLENYAGRFRKLANRHGLRLSIEAYSGEPSEDMAYGGRADEPMGEFWSWSRYGAASTCTEMASAAHVYGKPILGAESFTASDAEKWQGYPASIKELGDWAFCEGINRFVFHRYALQPWTNPDRRPGMSMGPWGLHYERTQTWWEQSKAWHRYLARCQFMLRQGHYVADLCFLEPEASPEGFHSPVKYGHDRPGYGFDGCTPEVVLTRMSVKDGRLVLPDGMSYRMLVLPKVGTMTPRLLAKIKKLVADGATVVGGPPSKSPSLSDYPKCDAKVKRLAGELWGTGFPPGEPTERRFGKGTIIWGGGFLPADEATTTPTNQLSSATWIWRAEGSPAEAAPPGVRYFRRLVTITAESPVTSARLEMTADNSFRCWVNGQSAGGGDDWNRIFSLDLAHLLKPGANLLAVAATNGGTDPNPAGMIGSLTIEFADGHSQHIVTDRGWETAKNAGSEWNSDATASAGWAAAMELGPMGMSPWGNPGLAASHSDSIPDIYSVCPLLAARGVPPDFAFQAADSSQCLRFIHRLAGGTDLYFVANKYPFPEDVLCSFRVHGRRPELWWPKTGRIERVAIYDERDGCVRLPIHLDPDGSVFVVFRDGARLEQDRVKALSRDGAPLLTTDRQGFRRQRVDNNEGLTGTFTFAGWVKPAADTDLPAEGGDAGPDGDVSRNDALYPPPGNQVYSAPDQVCCGLAVGRNGVSVCEHDADHLTSVLVFPTPITNWTHVAVVYRDGRPSLYLDGQWVHCGLKSAYVVHPGLGVRHDQSIVPFKGELGRFELFDHAFNDAEVAQLANSTSKPTTRKPNDVLELTRDENGGLEAEASRPGKYEVTFADGRTQQFEVVAAPQPSEITGPWDLHFPPNWGASEHVTLDHLISWSDHPDTGVKYFSGTAVYSKKFELPATLLNGHRRLYLDLGQVAVMARVKLNGKDLGILWKEPYRVEVTSVLRPGENDLEVSVVNLWINRLIGDEQLPEDSERNSNGTLKRWPEWILKGEPSPTGRFTFTTWRLWKKNDALVQSGLIGPVTLSANETINLKSN